MADAPNSAETAIGGALWPNTLVTRLRRYQCECDSCLDGDDIHHNDHVDAADVVEAQQAEIERLRELLERTYRLAVGHGPNWMVFDGWEEAISAYEEARRG